MAQGERPPRPTHPTFTSSLWELMQRCWDRDPQLRPEASEVLQVLLTLSVPRLSKRSLVRWPDSVLLYSDPPEWKQLISYPLPMEERAALITSIFSDPHEVEVVKRLSGSDAQSFVDRVDEVNYRTISSRNWPLTLTGSSAFG